MDFEDYTPYGANGFGRTIYIVTARMPDGTDSGVYGGTDVDLAERLAVSTYRRFHGKAYVSVDADGSPWKYVAYVPDDLSSARLTETGFCLHPRCGEIHPLECYCRHSMSADEHARWEEDRTASRR